MSRFFVSNGDGIEEWETEQEARRSAEGWIAEYRTQPEWDEAVERVFWGEIREYAHAAYKGDFVEYQLKGTNVEPDRMLKWFAYEHLPEKLQAVSKPFGDLARGLCETIEPGAERTVALRKLLEAKDAAVRAVVTPGG